VIGTFLQIREPFLSPRKAGSSPGKAFANQAAILSRHMEQPGMQEYDRTLIQDLWKGQLYGTDSH
jgi:hypothetical protein